MNKLSILSIALSVWLSATAFANSFTQIDTNNGEYRLKECGGTIEAKISHSGNGSDQINFILRNVQDCSNIEVSDLGKAYKLQGENGNRSGSYTISASKLPSGVNFLNVTVRSNSGAHLDKISIPVRVVRNDSLIGQIVFVPKKEAFAKVISRDNAYHGTYYLQFTTGKLNGLVGGNWRSSSLVLLSNSKCDVLCTGKLVIVPSKGFALAQVVAIQANGKYILKFLAGKLEGRYGYGWSTAELVY